MMGVVTGAADQHHRYFTGNFGGYTTIWDRACGTMRKRCEADFDALKNRVTKREGRNAQAASTPSAADLAEGKEL